MTNKNDDLSIVSEFLIRFYHQQPDYLEATIRALRELKGRNRYKWQLASAFVNILKNPTPEDSLKELVLYSANRFVQNDEEAKEVLTKIYDDNVLNTALYFDDDQD